MNIFWIKISKLVYTDFLSEIKNNINSENTKQDIIFTPNPEMLLETLRDTNFKNTLLKASYLTSDGIWLYIWYQILNNNYWKLINTLLIPFYIFNILFRKKFLYQKYSDRICWSDITSDLLKYSEEKKIKISIIDPYYPKDLKKCESQKFFRENLNKKFPNLEFDYFIYTNENKNDIITQIKNSESKILFSTLWMKRQEESVLEILEQCPNIKAWLWIWSSFDYFVWFQKRAPKIIRNIWFEWLYRIITWPQKIKRLNRLYNAIIVFTYKIIKTK